MSIKNHADTENNKASQATMAPGARPPGNDFSNVSFTSILNETSLMNLDAEGSEFREKFIKECNERLNKMHKFDIKFDNVPDGNGSLLIHNGQVYCLVMFDDALSDTMNLKPKSEHINYTVKDIIDKIDNYKDMHRMCEVIITRHDYKNLKTFVNAICNLFITKMKLDNMTVRNMTDASTEFNVTVSKVTGDQMMNNLYPHTVKPRADTSLILSLVNKEKNLIKDGVQEQYRPIMAVSGFTDIIIDNSTPTQPFKPIFRITDISSIVPSPIFPLIGLYLAGKCMAKDGHWLESFKNFNKSVKKPNLGALRHEEGKPTFFVSEGPMRDFVNKTFTPCIVAIDNTRGTFKLPIVSAIKSGNTGLTKAVIDYLKRFFNLRPDQYIDEKSATITSFEKNEFVGHYNHHSGEIRDTRDFTYLNIMAENPKPFVGWELFTSFIKDSYVEEHAKLINNFCGVNNFKSMHLNTVSIINKEFLELISQLIQSHGIKITESSMGMNNMFQPLSNNMFTDMSSLTDATRSSFGGRNIFNSASGLAF